MQFVLSIDCDNGAFDGAPLSEIARILRETADRLESGYLPNNLQPFAFGIYDINGNVVGSMALDA